MCVCFLFEDKKRTERNNTDLFDLCFRRKKQHIPDMHLFNCHLAVQNKSDQASLATTTTAATAPTAATAATTTATATATARELKKTCTIAATRRITGCVFWNGFASSAYYKLLFTSY